MDKDDRGMHNMNESKMPISYQNFLVFKKSSISIQIITSAINCASDKERGIT